PRGGRLARERSMRRRSRCGPWAVAIAAMLQGTTTAAEWEVAPEDGAGTTADATGELQAPPEATPDDRAPATAVQNSFLVRVVVRFSVPETGGALSPHFLFERELAFEARLEALIDSTFQPSAEVPYRRHHLQAALERHIAETLLASLNIAPAPSAESVDAQIRAARVLLAEQVGGALALQMAASAEGIGDLERRAL